MSHTNSNDSPQVRFVRAIGLWQSPTLVPDFEVFCGHWCGASCAVLTYAKEIGANFTEADERVLNSVLPPFDLPAHQQRAKLWLSIGKQEAKEANRLAHTVRAIVHGVAAVWQWRKSNWGERPDEVESARRHVWTCRQSYAAALPSEGPAMLEDNVFHGDPKLNGLLTLLKKPPSDPPLEDSNPSEDSKPLTVTHWLMLQRLFDVLLQNAPDYHPLSTPTRSASEATEPLGTEKASRARRVRIPTTVEHEVVTHLVGVNVRGETRRLTVSRVAEGPPGWYLDPTELGATCVAPEILEQLSLTGRVATSERRIEKQLKPDDPIPPLRVAIHSNLLASLTGRSAGLSLLMSMHAAANDGFLREDTLASSDIRVRPDFDQSQPLRLSDIETIPVEPKTVRLKSETFTGVPHLKRFVLSHAQTALDAAGQELAWETWTTDKVQESFRVEYVPIENGQAAWLQMSGRLQIQAVERYLDELIKLADTVPVYFPPGTELPNVRVQVRVRTEVFGDDGPAKANKQDHLNGIDPHTAYEHRLSEDEERQREHSQTTEIVLDWDSQVRAKLRRGVLLGDPGMGKSWLLKHEARSLAASAKLHLRTTGMTNSIIWPVLLPLSDLAQALTSRRDDQPRDLLSVVQGALQTSQVSEFVIKSITAAWGGDRCVLLLDAWDETDPSHQEALGQCLENWARDARYTQGRVLITSRVAGRPDSFWHMRKDSEVEREMEFQPFGDAQKREFIERFFRSTPHIANVLIAALSQAPQLRGLAQIPLLLSFLCCYAADQLSLADTTSSGAPTLDLGSIRRNVLYGYVVRLFLNKVWHSPHATLRDEVLKRRLKIVAHVAFHLLMEGYQKFPLSLFDDKLAAALHDDARGFEVPNSEFDKLRNELIGKDALIIPAGAGADMPYLFLHLTFQEYLAALHVKSLLWPQLEPLLGSHWDHPAWREVWDLVVQENSGDAAFLENMVATIHQPNHQHKLDVHLHRHRFTALRWLIISGQEPTDRTPILEASLRWSVDILNRGRPFFRCARILRTVAETYGGLPNALKHSLFRRLTNAEEHLREAVVSALGSHALSKRVQGVLIGRLDDDDESKKTREAVIIALAPHAMCKHVLAALLKRLGDECKSVRQAVAEALAPHAGKEPVQAALIRRLDDEKRIVRQTVVHALAIHAGSASIQSALLRRLDDKDDVEVEEDFEEMDGEKEDVNDDDVRDAVATALAPHASHEAVKHAFLRQLDGGHTRVLRTVAQALATHAWSESVQSELLGRLHDEREEVRGAVAQALVTHTGNELVRAAFIRMLADRHWPFYLYATNALKAYAESKPVQDAFLQRLIELDDEDEDLRTALVNALTPHAGSEPVQAVLFARLNDKRNHIRQAVAQALAPHAGTEFIQSALIQRLETEDDGKVRFEIAQALVPHAGNKPVQDAFLRQLDMKRGLGRGFVEAIGPHAGSAPLQDELLQRLNDGNGNVRMTVAYALAPHAGSKSVQDALLRRLNDERSQLIFETITEFLAPHAGSNPVQAELLRRFDDESRKFRATVTHGLAPHAGSEPVQATLIRQLDDEDGYVRELAVSALAPHTGSESVQAALIRQLDDENKRVRSTVAEALAPHAGTKAVQAALIRQLDDEEYWVRKELAEALAPHAGSKAVQAALVGRLDDANVDIRRIVAQALQRVATDERRRPPAT